MACNSDNGPLSVTAPAVNPLPSSRWFLTLTNKVGDKKEQCFALLDTGSSRSFIGTAGLSLVKDWDHFCEEIPAFSVVVANGVTETINTKIVIQVYLQRQHMELSLFIMPSLTVPILLGLDFLCHSQLCLDSHSNMWWFRDQPTSKFSFTLCDSEILKTAIPSSSYSCGIKSLNPEEKALLDLVVKEGVDLLKDATGLPE